MNFLKAQNKTIEYEFILYSLHEKEKTAFVVGSKSLNENIIIPRSIIHNTQEYTITRISSRSFCDFNIKTIQLAPDSELQTIEKNAFGSTIESISLPSSCIELEEGWCELATNLIKVHIDKNNQRYSVYDDKFIIGKTSKEKKNFDVLIFCSRDIKTLTIPSSIEIIGPYAFQFSKQLQTINFSNDSKLRIIDKNAFSCSSIENISIPPHLTKICEQAFSYCRNLFKFEIPKNSQLQTIEKYAFTLSSIESIFIPSSCTNIDPCWMNSSFALKNVYVDTNNSIYISYENKLIFKKSSKEKENFDEIFLCSHDIQTVTIPNYIEIIGPNSFYLCEGLKAINFQKNSKLRIIDEYAFYHCSNIENLSIPSNVVELKEGWCSSMIKLNKINVSPNNKYFICLDEQFLVRKSSLESKNYNILVAAVRNIEKAFIPSFIEVIESYAFEFCINLHQIEFLNDSKIQKIKKNAFINSGIKKIILPVHLTYIGPECFSFCDLKEVVIPENSELQIINKNAFSASYIVKITIPSKVVKISEEAFFACNQLRFVSISQNSMLQSIENSAFSNTLIESFHIPQHVKSIGDNAFYDCYRLQIIEINENSELQNFYPELIINNINTKIMIPVKFTQSLN